MRLHVFCNGSVFEGGEFVVYESKSSTKDNAQIIKPEFGSLTISYCDKEHEVIQFRVVRTSFVVFVSSYKGPIEEHRSSFANG